MSKPKSTLSSTPVLTKPQFSFRNKYTNPPPIAGEVFTKKSMTIPGQGITPQEIVRTFTEGAKFREFYTETNLSSFDKMDRLEKIDYLTNLSQNNIQMKSEIDAKIAAYKQKQSAQQKIADENTMRNKILEEQKKKRDELNDAKKTE